MNSVKTISFCFIFARISELWMGDGGDYLGLWGPWNKDSILSDCHRHTLVDIQPSARSLWIRENDNLLYHPNSLYGPLLSQGNWLLRAFVPPERYRKNRVPFCLTTSRNSEEFGKSSFNCLDICLLLFSYLSSFLYSAIKKYAGDEAAEILFISSFNLKQRGIRQRKRQTEVS